MSSDKGHGTKDKGRESESAGLSSTDSAASSDKKPWPMSWILIVILAYIALQTAYFLIYGE